MPGIARRIARAANDIEESLDDPARFPRPRHDHMRKRAEGALFHPAVAAARSLGGPGLGAKPRTRHHRIGRRRIGCGIGNCDMRLGVIADVHGNLPALVAVLAGR